MSVLRLRMVLAVSGFEHWLFARASVVATASAVAELMVVLELQAVSLAEPSVGQGARAVPG